MSEFEEQTVLALKTLFHKVDALRQIDIRDLLQPDVYYRYEDTLQAAYDALATVEDAIYDWVRLPARPNMLNHKGKLYLVSGDNDSSC